MSKNKRLLSVLYTLSLAVILYYPVSKIIKFETSSDYEEFKFKTAVYDPYDPMRGRYVQLRILPDEWKAPRKMNWSLDKGYAVIKKYPAGFAQLVRLEEERPQLQTGEWAVKVNKIYSRYNYLKQDTEERYSFSWPFNRFYLNELKAPELEKELQKQENPMILKVKIFRDGSFAVSGLEKP